MLVLRLINLTRNWMKSIRHVLIVGGVHGDELNGVYLINKFEHPSFRAQLQRSHLTTSTLLANPPSIAVRQRYVDMDLNRCFDRHDLENPGLNNQEQQLAKHIYRKIQENPVDFLLDLHTTTANMGLTLILGSDRPLNLLLAAHLSRLNPLVRVLQLTSTHSQERLRSLCPLGFTLEAGPIFKTTLDAHLFFQTEMLVHAILDYLNDWNQGTLNPTPRTLKLYKQISIVEFPCNQDGDVTAMLHPDRQGQDYQPLSPGDPLFIGFDGTDIYYEGEEVVYPVFVHEGAYWEKGIAMYLTTEKEVEVS